MYYKKYLFLLINLCWISTAAAENATIINSLPLVITSSPASAQSLAIDPALTVTAYAVNPVQPLVAVLLSTKPHAQKIGLWNIADNNHHWQSSTSVQPDITCYAMCWHPLGDKIFLLARQEHQFEIIKTPADKWQPEVIYTSTKPIQGLVINPRPFEYRNEDHQDSADYYRVFFGIETAPGVVSMHSITEKGEQEYTGLAAKSLPEVNTDVVLPKAFHPVGNIILWQDADHCFHAARYNSDNWQVADKALPNAKMCVDDLAYTPNAVGLLAWQKNQSGLTYWFDNGAHSQAIATQQKFTAAPQVTADGKGVVGLTQNDNRATLNYVPVSMPLADVKNAWMYLESPQDLMLFSKNAGLFRPVSSKVNQLFQFYSTEFYNCGSYDSEMPSRPYLVTTDIFWQLYAAAFEGIFINVEQQLAVPIFWQFIQTAHNDLSKLAPQSRMANLFNTLAALQNGNQQHNAEATKIIAAKQNATSDITKENFNYADLSPQGHYLLNNNLQLYYKALKYMTLFPFTAEDIKQLATLPAPALNYASSWLKIYVPFMTASQLSFSSNDLQALATKKFGPGIDNVIFSQTAPSKCGQQPCRLLPSGLDIAAVMGSPIALTILEQSGEFKKYPALKTQITQLIKQYKTDTNHKIANSFYQQWLEALGVQWASNIQVPQHSIQSGLWQTKRLQTGLASWTVLRHNTILSNATSTSACNQDGYEHIVMQPPYGYVEPDPKTFAAIANLFTVTMQWVQTNQQQWQTLYPDKAQQIATANRAMYTALQAARDEVNSFGTMADKELNNKPLTTQEYEQILMVGQTVEKKFLAFKNLMQKNSVTTPEWVTRITSIGTNKNDILFSAVGYPLEWDQIVPFAGQKEIVKGPIYSYFEFNSTQTIDDKKWSSLALKQARPAWIKPFMLDEVLTCPAKI